jgi:hypothetical protein
VPETDDFLAMRMGHMRVGFMVPLACGALVAAGGCSFSVGGVAVSKAQIEKRISDRLEATVGQRPKAIICPGNLKAAKGTKMRCQLEADNGSRIGLTVTVTSVEGKHVRFKFKVDNK